MNLPKHINMTIEHNPHNVNYETIQELIDGNNFQFESDEEKRRCINRSEIWIVTWYPKTPITFFEVCASTLDGALSFANRVER